MTHDHLADLLKRAAVRLSKSYFEAVEAERDRRWDGNVEEAGDFRDEAEEVRTLIEECRAAADGLWRDDAGNSPRSRARRSGVPASPSS